MKRIYEKVKKGSGPDPYPDPYPQSSQGLQEWKKFQNSLNPSSTWIKVF